MLADADETDAGIASAVNNAVARVAGLIGVSLVGVVVARTLVGRHIRRQHASRSTRSTWSMVICAVLVAAGGVTGAIGIVNPRRTGRGRGLPGRPVRRRARRGHDDRVGR